MKVIFDWFKAWSIPIDESLIPEIGFIVDNIAVGFLYLTDSAIGIIDGYVSNPESDTKKRSDALDLITAELIKAARARECKVIKCDTYLAVIKTRAMKFGFRSTGSYESFVMEI